MPDMESLFSGTGNSVVHVVHSQILDNRTLDSNRTDKSMWRARNLQNLVTLRKSNLAGLQRTRKFCLVNVQVRTNKHTHV